MSRSAVKETLIVRNVPETGKSSKDKREVFKLGLKHEPPTSRLGGHGGSYLSRIQSEFSCDEAADKCDVVKAQRSVQGGVFAQGRPQQWSRGNVPSSPAMHRRSETARWCAGLAESGEGIAWQGELRILWVNYLKQERLFQNTS